MQLPMPIVASLGTRVILGQSKVLTQFSRGVKSDAIGCNKLDEVEKKSISCRRPDLNLKPPPCYRYGFCREPDQPMRMSCPPKTKKRGRGPCCYEADDTKRGGCKTKK